MTRKSLALAGVAALGFGGLGAAPAHATLTYNGLAHTATGSYVTSGGLTETNWSGFALLVDQANTAEFPGYSLSGLTLNFSGEGEISGTLTNTGSNPVTESGASTTTFTYSTAVNSALNTALSSVSVVNALSSGLTVVAGNGSTPYAVPGVLPAQTTQTSGPISYASFLSLFEGSGTVEIDVAANANGGVSGHGSGNLGGSVNTFAAGDVTVIYTYTKNSTGVPEPMTAALFGTALLGLGFVRRRFG